MTCPTCSASIPADARFCPSCGHPVVAPSDERRVVTVLFGDIVGFTALAETRDPEQVKNLVDRCFDRLATDIRSFGGSVDKVIGDAVMALFGAPIAHEDDAERAVRAALQMQRTLTETAEGLGVDMQMRIGVNTGEVLVGAIRAGGDYTAMGDVVNTASRLQTIAQPGQVVVGPGTYAGTEQVFRYEPLGMLQARGREATVEAWVAVEALTQPGRRVPRRVSSRLVGRDAEADLLRNLFATAFAHRRPTLVVLSGEAGIGKSRLGEEVVLGAIASHQVRVLSGRAVPYGQANAWWPIAEVLRTACLITPEDAAADAQAKCLAAVTAALGEPEDSPEVGRVTEALLYLMGVEGRLTEVDRKRARDEVSRAVRTFIEGLASRQPLIITIADVQWADPTVLEGLENLLDRIRRVPLVILLTARPELQAVWRPAGRHQNLVVLNLDPLGSDDAADLLISLTGSDPGPAVRAELVERSGGNPLFVEELAALLAEREEPDEAGVAALPGTLRGIVAARLDGLPPDERGVLDDAAVLGRRGPVSAVEALAAGGRRGGVRDAVDRLVDRDLLVVEDGQVEFRSDLVREVVYGMLTKAERARRHAALATWLEGQAAEKDRGDEVLGELARHYATAAELATELGGVERLPADVRERAIDALEQAAERAENRELHLVAGRLFDQLVRLLGDAPSSSRRQALVGRARAATALRRHEAAAADLDLAEAEAEEARDKVALARALTVRGDLRRNAGDYQGSLAALESALTYWREVGDRRGEGSALRRLGWTKLFAGDMEGADPLLLQALEAFREAGALRGTAWAHQNLAWTAYGRGDTKLAEKRLADSMALFREIGDWGGLSWTTGMLGWVRYTQGAAAEAEQLAEQALGEAREQGDRWQVGMMSVLLGAIRLWQGRTQDAITLCQDADAVFTELRDGWGLMQAMAPLARSLTLTGRFEEADRRLEEARARADSEPTLSNFRIFPVVIDAVIGATLGDPDRTLRSLAEVHAEPDSTRWGATELLVSRGLAYLQHGEVDDAVALLRPTAQALTEVGPRANAVSALALCLAAAGELDEAMARSEEVLAVRGGTYIDRATAFLAQACVAARRGRTEETRVALDHAARLVEVTQDRVHAAVVALGRSIVLEAISDPFTGGAAADAERRLDELGIEAGGWDRALRLAAGLAVHA